MPRLSAARKVALSVLSERRRRDGRVRDLLRTSDAMAALDARDRALASRLALGATAAEGALDQVLRAYVKRPSSVEPRVRDALRLATFEACYLDTPASAVVSQGVELARFASPRAAGLANAVLRKVVSEARPRLDQARLRVEEGGRDAEDLALVSGLPRWLVERIDVARGADATRELALSQLEAAPVYVAPNRARHDESETLSLLRDAGLCPQPAGLPGAFELDTAAGLATSGLVTNVDVVVSDLAAQMVAHRAAPRPGQRVLEIGQGRGTKSILLENEALLTGGVATIVAVDSELFKVRIASRRMETAGLADSVSCYALDARQLASHDVPDAFKRPFDLVFIDAPCSGTGTMRRHPEIAWSLDEAALAGEGTLPLLQRQILDAAATRVAPGGRLVYATCSVLPEENERVIEAFLASDQGNSFELIPYTEEVPYLHTMPRRGGCDGHFCAVLQRRES